MSATFYFQDSGFWFWLLLIAVKYALTNTTQSSLSCHSTPFQAQIYHAGSHFSAEVAFTSELLSIETGYKTFWRILK